MTSRHTSAFDDLLEKNRRELDALYRDTGGAGLRGPGRTRDSSTTAKPAPAGPAPASETSPREPVRPVSGATTTADPSGGGSPTERLLNERHGDGWRFEITSRRREKDEVIVVGTLRLPGSGGLRTQFGSARISAADDAASGSTGGVAFSFGGGAGGSPAAAEEAAFERAREDALASCAALL